MKKTVRFEATQGLRMASSYGVTRKEDNVKLEVIIRIRDESRGSFELYDVKSGGEDWYAEGGLWFKGKDLVDYDGVHELPKVVESKIIEMGYCLDNL
jgi:hypothetical protein